jgi:hypothetical protein
MKPSAARFELPLVAAGVMIAMIVVMWVQGGVKTCTRSTEPARHLVLSRATDREHLATDLASANRIARRYMRSGVNAQEQQTLFVDCEVALVQQIATKHGLVASGNRVIE